MMMMYFITKLREKMPKIKQLFPRPGKHLNFRYLIFGQSSVIQGRHTLTNLILFVCTIDRKNMYNESQTTEKNNKFKKKL